MASFKVLDLNILISSEMSGLSPPMKVPTRAFWVYPQTWLPNLSNSFWYSRSGPTCRILDRASSKSSHSIGPNRAHISSTNPTQSITLPSSFSIHRNHCHHLLASPSKWNAASDTLSSSAIFWNSKNCSTQLSYSVGSATTYVRKSSLVSRDSNSGRDSSGLLMSPLLCGRIGSRRPVRWLLDPSLLMANESVIWRRISSIKWSLSAILASIRLKLSWRPPTLASKILDSLFVSSHRDCFVTNCYGPSQNIY